MNKKILNIILVTISIVLTFFFLKLTYKVYQQTKNLESIREYNRKVIVAYSYIGNKYIIGYDTLKVVTYSKDTFTMSNDIEYNYNYITTLIPIK